LYKARADFVGLSQLDGQGEEEPVSQGFSGFAPDAESFQGLSSLGQSSGPQTR
jgi:hypothetical protein